MMTEHITPADDRNDAPHQDVKDVALDIPGMLGRFTLPGFDLDGFLQSRKSDIDSVMKGTSAAFTGAETVVAKQAELLKTVPTELGDALRKMPPEAAQPADRIRKQQELAGEALSSALTSMKDIAETVGKSQSDVLEIVSARVRSNIDEIRRLTTRPHAAKNGTS